MDITRRLGIEKDLKSNRDLISDVIHSSGCLVVFLNSSGRIVLFNHACEKTTGYSFEEVQGKQVWDILLVPEDVEHVKEIYKDLDTGQFPNENESHWVSKDGTRHLIAWSNMAVLNSKGHVKYVIGTGVDITERRLAEIALKNSYDELEKKVQERTAELKKVNEKLQAEIRENKKSEKKYRDLFENAIDPIFIVDSDLKYKDVNKKAVELFGFSKEEFQNMRVLDVIPPEQISRSEREFDKLRIKGSYEKFTGKMRTKDGRFLDIEVSSSAIIRHGEVIGSRDIVRDITERKRIEEELRHSEEKYRSLIENIQDGVFSIQGDKILFANEAFARMAGYRVEEVIGKDFRELVAPEDRKLVEERYYQKQAGKDFLKECEFRVLQRDGGRVIVNMNVGFITYQGRVASIGTVKDVTERKRSEEKIKEQAEFLDKARDAIVVMDLDNRIIYWNESAVRLYGWNEKEALGENASNVLYKDPAQINEALRCLIEKSEWIGELYQVTKDGKEIIVESRWTLMKDSGGNARSILIINTDITEKKKLETQFLRAQRMESIGTLAGGIAHDINNVLTPIMLSLELLKERFPDEKSQKLLNIIKGSTQRGANLVKQVMSFARGIEGEYTILDLKLLINDIEKITKETFPKSIEIRTSGSKNLRAISGDFTQLHQVLMNLCLNARDAMPDGGILIISAENLFNNGSDIKDRPYILITVSDNGTGIPEEFIDRIFEPFFTTKEPGKGTGIGLSTAFSIVRSHEGFIDVDSIPGQGTIFRVYLPALEMTDSQEDQEQPSGIIPGNKESILVVDDEASVRETTRATLEAYGYSVITADNGKEAIELYSENVEKIRVVITDMIMSAIAGPETIQAIRKINPLIRIVAVSGLMEIDKLKSFAEGHVDAYLSKPYTAVELLNTIHEVLNNKSP